MIARQSSAALTQINAQSRPTIYISYRAVGNCPELMEIEMNDKALRQDIICG